MGDGRSAARQSRRVAWAVAGARCRPRKNDRVRGRAPGPRGKSTESEPRLPAGAAAGIDVPAVPQSGLKSPALEAHGRVPGPRGKTTESVSRRPAGAAAGIEVPRPVPECVPGPW